MDKSLIRRWLFGLSVIAILPLSVLAQTEFVYLNNGSSGNSVSGFSVSKDGTLIELPGSPFQTGGWGFSGGDILVVRGFLYVVNTNSGNISASSIDPLTGNLTEVPGSPFSVPTESFGTPRTLAATPDGKFLIVNSAVPGTISILNIASDGSLAPVTAQPFHVGEIIRQIKVSPDGKFLAAAVYSRSSIVMLNIAADGTLTPVPGSPFPTTHAFAFASAIDFSCDGSTLFVGNATISPPLIDVFSVGSSGALTPVTGSPFRPGAGADSGIVQMGPNNQYFFVTNFESATVTVFRVRPDRSLEPVSGSPFQAGGLAPSGISINQSGTVLVVVINGSPLLDAGVGAFKIAPDGTLIPVTGSPFKLNIPAYNTRLSSITSYPVHDCALRVDGISVKGKKLFVAGQNFDNGSVILLNGEPQNTKNDAENWTTTLIGKKSGKNVRIGDKIQALTSNGRLSPVFTVASLAFP